MDEIPLLPLKTVLLPGNKLALKIFETRYLDMVAKCMREEGAIGIVHIHSGEETLSDTDIHAVGTLANICNWKNRADGLLGITVEGQQRFEIISTETQADGLTIAQVTLLLENDAQEMPEQFLYMQELLEHIHSQQKTKPEITKGFSNILYQLIYLLPIEANLKQRLLEIDDASDRAVILHAELIRLGVIQYIKPEAKTN